MLWSQSHYQRTHLTFSLLLLAAPFHDNKAAILNHGGPQHHLVGRGGSGTAKQLDYCCYHCSFFFVIYKDQYFCDSQEFT